MASVAILGRHRAEDDAEPGGKTAVAIETGVVRIALVYALVAVAYMVAVHFIAGGDYVGADNDDVMRLVEVRDLLAGQSWFDMHQYRLGLDGGTLMHWSRFIDLPIAALIRFFSLFLGRDNAEAAALVVWPSLTVVPLFIGMGLSGRRLAGPVGTHVTIGLAALYIVCINRFDPGQIDHDNVQLGLTALMAAMLIDPLYRRSSFAFAGFLAGMSIAIGVETVPYVAVGCAAVALLWGWHGAPMARAAQGFGLALAATLAFAFYATTPPQLYSAVRCDTLSVGFYVLGTVGGGLLFFAVAATASRRSRGVRFAALGLCAIVVAAAIETIMPQCLRGPYADLDPLIKTLWLDNITEARSFLGTLAADPWSVGAFYAVPLIGLGVCAWRIAHSERREAHILVAALLATAFAIALFEVRSSKFAAILAFLPLGAMIADLRRRCLADTRNVKRAAIFILATLASVPPVWAFGGGLLHLGLGANDAGDGTSGSAACKTPAAIAPLDRLPAGLVAGPSNMGVAVLRYTHQRVLAAPYHRDPGGILAVLHIETAPPAEAEAYFRRSGATIFAYCPPGPERGIVTRAAPNGLLASIARGDVPDYLQPVAGTRDAAVRYFRFVPTPK